MVVFDNLKDINVKSVYYKGKLVAENDQMTVEIKKPVIEIENRNTVTIKDFSVENFKIKVSSRKWKNRNYWYGIQR